MNIAGVKTLFCIRNDDCDDLILHKVYREKPDRKARNEGFVRIIDESGEDYLYPAAYFSDIHLTGEALEAVLSSR